MLPRFFKFRFKNVIGHIKLYWNYAYIIICQSPYISILAFIKIYKFTGKPEIFTAVRIVSFYKILFILRIRLAADHYSFYLFNSSQWNVYIQYHVLILLFGQ